MRRTPLSVALLAVVMAAGVQGAASNPVRRTSELTGLNRLAAITPTPGAFEALALYPGTARRPDGRGAVAKGVGRSLRVDLGRVRGVVALKDVVRVTNRTAKTTVVVAVRLSGVPQLGQLRFEGKGQSIRLKPGQSGELDLSSGPAVAGRGAGSIVLTIAGKKPLQARIPVTVSQAPAAPTGLAYARAEDGSIRVSWRASRSRGAAGYNVYRLDNGPAVKLNARPVLALSFTDRATLGGRFAYAVRAIAKGVKPQLESTGAVVAAGAFPAAFAPGAPEAVTVPASAGSPAGTINCASAGKVSVRLTLPASTRADDVVHVSLSDGARTVAAKTPGKAGGGVVTVPGLDAASLRDGPITLRAQLFDVFGIGGHNVFGSAALKDTVSPAPPVEVGIAASGLRPHDTISRANQAAAAVSIGLPASSSSTDTVELFAPGYTSKRPATAGTGTVEWGLDARPWSDGSVRIEARTLDAAGNASEFTGVFVRKDTVAPPAPVSVRVAATASNPVDTVSAASAAAVSVTVSLAGASGDTVTVSLSDGAHAAVTASRGAGGSSTLTVTGLDVSALDDASLALSATATDAAGNVSQAVTGSALKDTRADVVSASVAATGANQAGYINTASKASVSVAVQLPASSTPSHTLTVTLSDSTTTTAAATAAGSSGAGTVTVSGIDASALADGSVHVRVRVQDTAGNDRTFVSPTDATKDTTIGISSISVPAGPTGNATCGSTNIANTVTLGNVAAATVQVTLPATSQSTDTVTVRLSTGVTQSNAVSVSGSAGAGTVSATGLNSSSLDEGAVTVTVQVTDLAGNSTSYVDAASVSKHTAAPATPGVVITYSDKATPTADQLVGAAGTVGGTVPVLALRAATGVCYGPVNSGANGSFTLNVADVTSGSVTYDVVQRDAYGNASAARSVTAADTK